VAPREVELDLRGVDLHQIVRRDLAVLAARMHLAARPVLLERQQLESGTAGSSLTAY